MQADTAFIHEFAVGDKTFRLDALLVLSELTLAGADQEPTKEQLMAAVRSSVRPPEMGAALTNAEALALALRVTMSLKSLGNAGAP
jgi:hypothetical protein